MNVVKCRSQEQEGVEGLLLIWFWHFCGHLLPFPHIEWQGFCLSDPRIKEYGPTVRLCHCGWHTPPPCRASLVAQTVKNLPANVQDLGSIPGLGRSPGEENGNPLWCSCLGMEEPGGLQSVGWQRVRHPEQLMVTDWRTTWYSGNGLGSSLLSSSETSAPCGGDHAGDSLSPVTFLRLLTEITTWMEWSVKTAGMGTGRDFNRRHIFT